MFLGLDILEPLIENKADKMSFIFCSWCHGKKQIHLADIFNDTETRLQPEVQPEAHLPMQ